MPAAILPPCGHTDLPVGLPDHVYATWLAVRRQLRTSKDLASGELRYQFCCGYVQALIDAQVIDDLYGSRINADLREIWPELLNHWEET
ncbi:hypothetical protein IFT80_21455 [Pseudomonas sp. CFBP 8771]|uniref:hypothetical protein n=1 Tax=Pseudomonas sp. CFBP 8771 TaxID=2775285 RepID=UPI0017805894|nr:hypothetical protein [Pseudomonas sp. CFBP 8771]MBD8605205.1 hypothetical protein [Pseudomonas sp. CFBP 8771]